MWLPPPVPLCRPSRPNVSVPRRHWRAVSYRLAVSSAELGPARRRVHVDLDHARIGGDHQHPGPRVRWRPVALEDHRYADLTDDLVEQADQLGELLQLLQRRQVEVHDAVPGLHHQRGPRGGLVGVDHDRLGGAGRELGAGLRVVLLALELRVLPVHRGQRHPRTGRGVAGQQHQPSATEPPAGTGPAVAPPGRGERQRPGGRDREVGVERGHQVRIGADRVVARRPAGHPRACPPRRPARRTGPRSRPAAPRPAARTGR